MPAHASENGILRATSRLYVSEGGLLVRARRMLASEGGTLRPVFELGLPVPSHRRDATVDSGGITLFWNNGVFPESDVTTISARNNSESKQEDPLRLDSLVTTYFAECDFTVNDHTRSVLTYYSQNGATWIEVDGYDVSPGSRYSFRAPSDQSRPSIHMRVTTFAGPGFGGVQGFTGYAKS